MIAGAEPDAMHSRMVGVIDIGSNTIRLSVFAIAHDSFSLLFGKKSAAGLAGYVEDDVLTDAGIDRAIESLRYLLGLLVNLDIREVHVFATASLRDIANSRQARFTIESACGVEIELISGPMEAELGFRGLEHECGIAKGASIDIGGGSTEVTSFSGCKPDHCVSMPVGSLKLYTKSVAGILPTSREISDMAKRIQDTVMDAGIPAFPHEDTLCGIGGTVRAARKLLCRLDGADGSTRRFPIADLESLSDTLCSGDRGVIGLVLRCCPDRIHTIIPGVLILRSVANILDCKEIYISDYGVREGYVCKRILESD